MSDSSRLSQRPSMHAKDSFGKSVSLLNDDAAHNAQSAHLFQRPRNMPLEYQSNSSTSRNSSPPELTRADSFEDYAHAPLSPITPVTLIPVEFGSPYYKDQSLYEYRERIPSYDEYPPVPQYVRQSLDSNTSYRDSQVYEEDYQNSSSSDRGQKRYPCRYKDSHGCEKTFTTSGHASRHSKIHTAEKAVSCTWTGCPKKFTRADNMKQHLETHTKEKSRSSSHSSAQKASPKILTQPARIQKPSIARPLSRASIPSETSPHLDPAILQASYPGVSIRGGGLEVLASACASQA